MSEDKTKKKRDKENREKEDNKEKEKEEQNSDEEKPKKGRISEESINYFKRVEQVLIEDSFDDNDHKQTFLRNVCHQIETDGSQLARHTLTSKVLERVIPHLNSDLYKLVLGIMRIDVACLCTDRFASHVIETLCRSVSKHFDDTEIVKLFCRMCKAIRADYHEYLRNVFGSHVISVVLQTLSGVTVPETVSRSRTCRESNKNSLPKFNNFKKEPTATEISVTDVPEAMRKSFNRYYKAISDDDNFGELLCHRTASPVLQVLLIVLSKLDKTKFHSFAHLLIGRSRILENIQNEDEDDETNNNLPVVPTDEVGSHLLEAVLRTADTELFDKLAEQCFNRIFITLCMHPVANYIAQTFLKQMTSKTQAEPAIEKCIKYMEDILASGHLGCAVHAAETIARLDMCDHVTKFVEALATSLHISAPEQNKQLVKLVLSLVTYETYFKTDTDESAKKAENDSSKAPAEQQSRLLVKDDIEYHGACLFKQCLSFSNNCDMLVNSFLSLGVKELLCVSNHPNGNHAFEMFFSNENIAAKKKKKMIDILLPSLDVLVSDKFGSRVFDSFWKVSDKAYKDKLLDKLRGCEIAVAKSKFGRICLFNTGLRKPRNDMASHQVERKRKIMQDVIAEKREEVKEVVVKKKKKDNRAEKYRDQLKSLGISFEVNEEKQQENKEKEKPDDTMTDIIQVIEATTKKKKKKKKI